MIRIVYRPEKMQLQLKGHAGKRGESLVCAAVSVLVQTLLAQLLELQLEKRLQLHWHLESGRGEILCSTPEAEQVRSYFELICHGFELLQTAYPADVQYRKEDLSWKREQNRS